MEVFKEKQVDTGRAGLVGSMTFRHTGGKYAALL